MAGITGGAVEIDTGTLSLTRTVFNNIKARDGGILYLNNKVDATIDSI